VRSEYTHALVSGGRRGIARTRDLRRVTRTTPGRSRMVDGDDDWNRQQMRLAVQQLRDVQSRSADVNACGRGRFASIRRQHQQPQLLE
jgi:hypothetical protein